MEELSKHGIFLPPNMQGLTDEQITDLRLRDEWEDKCVPSGGYVDNKDPIGRRNGRGWLTTFKVLCGFILLLVHARLVQSAQGHHSQILMMGGGGGGPRITTSDFVKSKKSLDPFFLQPKKSLCFFMTKKILVPFTDQKNHF